MNPGADRSTTPPEPVGLRARSEVISARLPPLLVEAERVAATVAQGVHGRRRVGMGETFWQYRHAREGDSSNAIDWRQSAKSDRLYIRENEWEAAETVWLWCDRSPSMAYVSAPGLPPKLNRASVLTLALANLLVRGGERVGLVSHAGGAPRPLVGRGALDRLVEALTGPSAGQSLPPATPLPRHCHLVIVSDFFSPLDEIAPLIRAQASHSINGSLLQVIDPAEEDLPFDGRTEFADPETRDELIFERPQLLRERYRARLHAHRDALRALTRTYGWNFAVHRTDRPAEEALLALYVTLAGTGTRAAMRSG